MLGAPGDDALRFLRVGRTQVRDLRRLKLGQLRFPAQDPKKRKKGRDEQHIVAIDDGRSKTEVSYSRTADAESVVLNFAKVLTYSRVLLYTLRERESEGQNRIGVGGGRGERR